MVGGATDGGMVLPSVIVEDRLLSSTLVDTGKELVSELAIEREEEEERDAEEAMA